MKSLNYTDVGVLPPGKIQVNLQSFDSKHKPKAKRIVVRTRKDGLFKNCLQLVKMFLSKIQKLICCLKLCSPPIFNMIKKAFLKNANNSHHETKSSISFKEDRSTKKMVQLVTILMLVKRAIGFLIDRSLFRNTKKLSNQDFLFIGDKTYHQKEIKNRRSSSTSKKNRIMKFLFPRKWRLSRRPFLKLRKIESLLIK